MYEPNLKSYTKAPESRLFRSFLLRELGQGGPDAEQAARTAAFSTIGGQQMAAEDAARRGSVGSLGANNIGGMLGNMQGQIRMSAPYGQAEQSARAAGKQAVMNAGQGWQNWKQGQANWMATMMGPYLTQQQIENQAAAMAAGAGGGFDWQQLIGPGLGAAAALML